MDKDFDNKEIRFFAVFDGHGGKCVAKYCEDHFLDTLKNNENFKKGIDEGKEGNEKYHNYKTALTETSLEIDK